MMQNSKRPQILALCQKTGAEVEPAGVRKIPAAFGYQALKFVARNARRTFGHCEVADKSDSKFKI